MRVAARTLPLLVLLAASPASTAFAAPVLTGATLSYNDQFGPLGPESAPFVAGPEYCGTLGAASCNGTTFGGDFGVLLSNDFIDFTGTSITFGFEGGGDPLPLGYRDLGLDATATFTISGLTFSEPGFLNGVSVSLIDAIGVAVGSEVTFTANSISFIVGTLGILEGNGGPGRIVLNLAISNSTQPPPVPEPTTLVLLGAASVMAVVRARRRAER